MFLATAAVAAASLLPAVNVARDDTPPEPIYVADVTLFVLVDDANGGPTCQGYWELRQSVDPALAVTPEGGSFSALDSFAIVAYEEIDGGRMTDAARDFFVSWLHTC